MIAQILSPASTMPAWPFIAAGIVLAVIVAVVWWFGSEDEPFD